MKVRFLADADLNRTIVRGVLRREPALDFLTAHAAGLRGMNDSEVLALAAERQRALVSHHVGTMPAQFRAFRSAGKQSSGVFLIPPVQIRIVADGNSGGLAPSQRRHEGGLETP